MNIYPAFISKHNFNHENQIILLKILNGQRWYYLAIKELSALLNEIPSKEDFFCLNF